MRMVQDRTNWDAPAGTRPPSYHGAGRRPVRASHLAPHERRAPSGSGSHSARKSALTSSHPSHGGMQQSRSPWVGKTSGLCSAGSSASATNRESAAGELRGGAPELVADEDGMGAKRLPDDGRVRVPPATRPPCDGVQVGPLGRVAARRALRAERTPVPVREALDGRGEGGERLRRRSRRSCAPGSHLTCPTATTPPRSLRITEAPLSGPWSCVQPPLPGLRSSWAMVSPATDGKVPHRAGGGGSGGRRGGPRP